VPEAPTSGDAQQATMRCRCGHGEDRRRQAKPNATISKVRRGMRSPTRRPAMRAAARRTLCGDQQARARRVPRQDEGRGERQGCERQLVAAWSRGGARAGR